MPQQHAHSPQPLIAALAVAALSCLLLVPAADAGARAAHTDGTKARVSFPHAYTLQTSRVAHWAKVENPVAVHARPSLSSRIVARLGTVTSEGTVNLVLVLEGVD